MSAPVRHLSPNVLACLWWLVAALMAAAFFKEPHSVVGFISIASPYAFLIGTWIAYRGISELLKRNFAGPQATLVLLQERLAILAIFSFAGIGIAMMMGMLVQRSVIR